MTLEQAIHILKLHNIWRRGAEIAPQNQALLGQAIDIVVNHYYKEKYFLTFNLN